MDTGHEDAASADPDGLKTLVAGLAWDAFLENVGENEGHLASYAEAYEDDTDREIHVPRDKRYQRGGELHDPRFKAWCEGRVAEEAADLAQALTRLFKDGHIRCWRALVAPADWKPEGPNCGIHWSFDPSQAVAHFGEDVEGRVFVVEAEVPFSSVNWEATVRANLSEEFGDECEITLDEGAPVTVVGVSKRVMDGVSADAPTP